MALSWMERFKNFFGADHKEKQKEDSSDPYDFVDITDQIVGQAVSAPVVAKPQLSEFEKLHAKFDLRKDMIVMSYSRAQKLKQEERNWLDSLGDKVYFFDTPYEVNMAIIRSY